jgi:DNA-binding MarR family transcriptional regulator
VASNRLNVVGVSARQLTALADGLEDEGLAKRVDHPSDRRVTLLELTPAGMDKAEETLGPRFERMGRLFDHLSPSQRAQFARTLRILRTAMHDDLEH